MTKEKKKSNAFSMLKPASLLMSTFDCWQNINQNEIKRFKTNLDLNHVLSNFHTFFYDTLKITTHRKSLKI